ncbi:mitochondrial matrix Mmp37-domain-containing protein [Fimicolochytrium jonesii]|uniref:mitochondrial matrix Mmp37-domain-containing protein n=1 Tax=Fimicolochytrium jonesii TaxID=1396493 RepID=UPI0022FEF82C|nr:mitochondrial matrix Mmp37-domain-containing protein [Fimicolochytrium jonesii]KAI8815750.1 mitochondrial matrix Mmp37-domain-containing protein [Fimicolochytrium jonesii]
MQSITSPKLALYGCRSSLRWAAFRELSTLKLASACQAAQLPSYAQRRTSISPLRNHFGRTSPLSSIPSHTSPTVVLQQDNKAALVDDKLAEVLADFHAPVRYAVAYGSGVFQQKGYKRTDVGAKVPQHNSDANPHPDTSPRSQDAPMVDFLFGVTHPEHWHSLNIRQNRHHYSSLAFCGSRVVAQVQDKIGAGLYFNTDVEVAGVRIKYGVVSIDRLIKDLLDWETLYLAGRLHKPVKVLRDDARVSLANRRNLRAAVRAALLTLPQELTEEDLFLTIAGLSFRGDFRMRMGGENPHKVYNIVYSQMDEFRAIYKPIVEDLPNVNYTSDNTILQDPDLRLRATAIQKLPKTLHDKIYTYYKADHPQDGTTLEEPKFSQTVAKSDKVAAYVEKSLADIVRHPAITQSLKGFLTAGLRRAVIYAWAKLKKGMKGKRKA